MERQPTQTFDPNLEELVLRYRSEPAPLLPILHAIQDRHGYLPEDLLDQVANLMQIPPATLYGIVSFYSYFRLKPEDITTRGVCHGPVCAFASSRGAAGLPAGDSRGGMTGPTANAYDTRVIACPGRCDRPVPRWENDQILDGAHERLGPLPVQTGIAAVYRDLDRDPPPTRLKAYRRVGGYVQLERLLHGDLKPAMVIEEIITSGLAGRGGAGFPTGEKWAMVASQVDPVKYIVCNADEGEPGTFKDRPILEYLPHRLLEGMAIAGHAVGATIGVIYLRYEYPAAYEILAEAIAEAMGAGLLGPEAGFTVYLRRGAGAYICGEETSLLNSLEGLKPYPREKPPFPTEEGLYGRPTVVNNVETLAAVPVILEKGGAWFKALGKNGAAGTKCYSLSGHVVRPGNYELPMGTTARELIEGWGGGIPSGRRLKAFTIGGVSGGFLPAAALDMPLDLRSPKGWGTFLGSGGVIVYDETTCMVQAALRVMEFFRHESCGKCFPCRIGTMRLEERLTWMAEARAPGETSEEVPEIEQVMATLSACGLGLAAPLSVSSVRKYFPEEWNAHLQGVCPTGRCREG